MDARVASSLSRHLCADRLTRFCVGLSGGLDSVVLLHLAATFRKENPCELSAVHIHHGLSAHADAWADFVCAYATSLNIVCHVAKVDVSQRAEYGLEGAARLARYAVFAQQACDVLLLAHHQNDQAETVLLNLLRGSGVSGMAAMPAQRVLIDNMTLLRPLLDVARADLEEYARAQQLSWVEDESNLDQRLDRNFLRHTILPQLQNKYPASHATLARTAYHLGEAHQLQQEIAIEDARACVLDGVMNLDCLLQLSEVRQRNVMRYWLAQSAVVADTRAFDDLMQMMRSADAESLPLWRWRGQAVRRYKQHLYITPADLLPGPVTALRWRDASEQFVPEWRGRVCWQKSQGMGISETFLSESLSLRARSGGEKLRLAANRPRRLLKHLWQEMEVAPWLRDAVPLLYINDELAYVPYVGVADKFAVENGWQMIWQAH